MIRLIYDECNPTRDRRPTTVEDVENDIHVEDFDSIPEVIEALNEDYMEIADNYEIDPDDEMAVLDTVIDILSDPGDGSYNILYLGIDGKEYYNGSYDGMETLDLETASEEDVKDAILAADEYEDDYDYDEDEDDVDESWYKGIDDDGDVDFVEDEIEEDYSDDYKNERYERLVGKKIRILNMDDPYSGKDYNGREGVIEYVATDPWGDVYFDGTWGSLSIYPKVDSFEYIDDDSLTEDSDNDKQSLEKAKADWQQKYEEARKLGDELAKYNIPYVKTQTQDGKTVEQPDFSKVPENERKSVEELYKKYKTASQQNNMAMDNYYKLAHELGESLVENIFDEELNTIIDKSLKESFITEGKFKDKVKGFIGRITKAAAQGVTGGAVGGITAGPIGAAVGAGLGAAGDIVKSIVGDIIDWLKGKKSKDNHEIKDAENDIINKLGYAKAKPVLYNMRKEYDNLQFSEDLDEGLFDAEKETINYGHKAWVLNQIISSMNDETAYFDTEWLYVWPDGETEKECDDDFGDEESFKELEDTFISIYKYNSADEEGCDPEDAEYNFHRDGLYNPTKEAVQVAHEYDKKLGLEPIKVLGNVKECVDDVRFAESVETDNLETFDDKMDFLAGDEEEAIDGYDEIIPEVEDEHIKDQLTHIRDEEKAHKKYLNDVKKDPSVDYKEPEELEEDINEDVNNYEVNYSDCDFGRTDGEYYFSTNISQNDNEDDNLQITIYCETDKDCINCYYDEIEKFQGYSYGENVVELDPNDVETEVMYSTWDDFSKKFTKDEVVNVYGISAEDLDALTQKARNEAVDTFINDVIEYYSENMDEIIPEDDGPDPDYEYERYRDMRDEH